MAGAPADDGSSLAPMGTSPLTDFACECQYGSSGLWDGVVTRYTHEAALERAKSVGCGQARITGGLCFCWCEP